jgi:hypothetical protein
MMHITDVYRKLSMEQFKDLTMKVMAAYDQAFAVDAIKLGEDGAVVTVRLEDHTTATVKV